MALADLLLIIHNGNIVADVDPKDIGLMMAGGRA